MSRQRAQQLAAEFLTGADPTGWFEVLYAEAGNNYAAVPWANLAPNPNLVDWMTQQNQVTFGEQEGKRLGKAALTIGCGYGDDAEFLAEMGFQVTAFDISSTAIAECQRRFPQSQVAYQVADVLNPPNAWFRRFDFVLEAYTLQALSPELRMAAIANISQLLAPTGQLLVIARGRDATEPPAELPPYPLTQKELTQFERLGLCNQSFEDYLDTETPPVRRFRVLYER